MLLIPVWLACSAQERRESFDSDTPVAPWVLTGAAGALLVGAVMLFDQSSTVIAAKEVGVLTSLGKPVETLDSGWHWKKPWTKVAVFDGTLQSLTLAGTDQRVEVRLAGQSVGWVDVNLQWRVDVDDGDGVMSLFSEYRDPAKVDGAFVERQVRAALYEVFADYDPTAGLGNARKPKQVSTLAEDARTVLDERLDAGIEVKSLTISGVSYDRVTQDRIDSLRRLAADVTAAALRAQIAGRSARANDMLAKGDLGAGVLYTQCLELTERLLGAGKELPPSWNCALAPDQVLSVNK